MRKTLLISIFLLIMFVTDSSANAAQPALPSPNEVISLINQYRQQNGIPALEYNALLASLAQGQSDYQAQISTITHTGPGGTSPQERATAAGYGGGSWVYLSEIIYGGMNATPSSALSWWMNSSLHNSIMLDSKYTEIGAGVATDGTSTYFTAELGNPTGGSGSTSPSPTQPTNSSGENPVPTDPASVIMPVTISTPGSDGAIRHLVLQGQTLWTIAAIYETTTEILVELNQLESTYIFPGDELLIEPATEQKTIQLTGTPQPTQSEVINTAVPSETKQPRLGTPYSLVLAQPTSTQAAASQPEPQPEMVPESSTTKTLLDRPFVNTLLIAAVVILVLVILVSGFMQNKPGRTDRDDLVN